MCTLQKLYSLNVSTLQWAIKWRQPFSITVILACAILLLITPPTWQHESVSGMLLDSISLVLIVIATFGRLWSSLYISGHKEHRLVAEGPYSIVRNPLYVFSFIGALGLGLATLHLSVLIIISAAFILYYPLVVLAEEHNLRQIFGSDYEQYRSQVPRFYPRRFKMIEPDTYPVRPGHVRRSMQEIVCFFWAYLFLKMIVVIQDDRWLPSSAFNLTAVS